jgi:hypothetical protein
MEKEESEMEKKKSTKREDTFSEELKQQENLAQQKKNVNFC